MEDKHLIHIAKPSLELARILFFTGLLCDGRLGISQCINHLIRNCNNKTWRYNSHPQKPLMQGDGQVRGRTNPEARHCISGPWDCRLLDEQNFDKCKGSHALEICGHSGRSLIFMLDCPLAIYWLSQIRSSILENRGGPGVEENRRGGAGVALKSTALAYLPLAPAEFNVC